MKALMVIGSVQFAQEYDSDAANSDELCDGLAGVIHGWLELYDLSVSRVQVATGEPQTPFELLAELGVQAPAEDREMVDARVKAAFDAAWALHAGAPDAATRFAGLVGEHMRRCIERHVP